MRNYSNERSLYLAQLRHSIEEPWQQWESSHFDIKDYKSKTVEQVLWDFSETSVGCYWLGINFHAKTVLVQGHSDYTTELHQLCCVYIV